MSNPTPTNQYAPVLRPLSSPLTLSPSTPLLTLASTAQALRPINNTEASDRLDTVAIMEMASNSIYVPPSRDSQITMGRPFSDSIAIGIPLPDSMQTTCTLDRFSKAQNRLKLQKRVLNLDFEKLSQMNHAVHNEIYINISSYIDNLLQITNDALHAWGKILLSTIPWHEKRSFTRSKEIEVEAHFKIINTFEKELREISLHPEHNLWTSFQTS